MTCEIVGIMWNLCWRLVGGDTMLAGDTLRQSSVARMASESAERRELMSGASALVKVGM
jgi:hypothetical protein